MKHYDIGDVVLPICLLAAGFVFGIDIGLQHNDPELCALRADTSATADTLAIIRAHPECVDHLLDTERDR